MDQKQIAQWLAPAAAAGGLIVLLGVLIALSDSTAPSPVTGSGAANLAPPPDGGGAVGDSSGMAPPTAAGKPAVDAPEWKPGPGEMKVWDVAEGAGEPVQPGATVTIHYTGWNLDGSVFDSSVQRNEPATFPLGNLIKGWQEGIPGMKPGGVRRLYIPWAWAYGERGSPPKIPARADLIFEVKLLK